MDNFPTFPILNKNQLLIRVFIIITILLTVTVTLLLTGAAITIDSYPNDPSVGLTTCCVAGGFGLITLAFWLGSITR